MDLPKTHHPAGLIRTLTAQVSLESLAISLTKAHAGTADTLREGLAEALTIARLGVPATLARTL